MPAKRQVSSAATSRNGCCHDNVDCRMLLATVGKMAMLLLAAVRWPTTVAASDGASAPVIDVHPSSIYIPELQAKTLSCRASGSPQPRITWYKDGVRVVTQRDDPGSYYEMVPEGDLLLLRAQRHHFGQYYCNASNEYGYAISNNVSVSMAYIHDDFRRLPEDQSVVSSGVAQFYCQPPTGAPLPTVRWHIKINRRQDFWIPPQTQAASGSGGSANSAAAATAAGGSTSSATLRRFSMDPATGTLTISPVQKLDSGEYKCVAHNDAGEKQSLPARLTVWEKPLISEPPVHMIVNQGQDAKFRCVVTGDPTPTVRWLKNGAEPEGGGSAGGGGGSGGGGPSSAGSSNSGGGRSIVMPDSSLVVRGVTPSDEGSYTCVATNEGGNVEATAYLTVNTPPRFLLEPYDKVAAVARSVLFYCIADGSPPPSVYWQKQAHTGEQMFPRHSYGKFSVSDVGTLRIDDVQQDDEGDYICYAHNIAGQESASARLRVRDNDDLRPPMIIEGPGNVTAQTSTSVGMQCRASGSPPPVVRWLKNGRPIAVASGSRFSTASGVLRIADVHATDSGNYTCFASSESGEASASAQLTVLGMHNSAVASLVPPPPGKPRATTVLNAFITLTWLAGESRTPASTLDSYAVEMFSYAEEKGWTQGRFVQGAMTGGIHNLLPGNDYVFLVRAQNEYGVSEPSPLSDIVRTTGEAVQSSLRAKKLFDVQSALMRSVVVKILPPQVVSSTSVNVSWTVLERNKMVHIEGFYIRISSARQQTIVEQVYSVFSTYKRVAGLHPNTAYQFSVAPFYYNVSGAPSDVAEARTLEDVPSGPPRNVRISADRGRVLVSWEPVLEEHSGGTVLGYLISCVAADKALSQNFTVNATTTKLLVDSLRSDVTYQLSVAARTQVGVGVASGLQQLSPWAASGASDGQSHDQSLVDEPWFLPTVIGMIGFTLCAVLLALVVCVCTRRRAARRQAKKDNGSSGIISVPLENMPQMCVDYQTDSAFRPPSPRSGGARPSQTSDSVSRSMSNTNMSNKVDEYNLDGSVGSLCHKSFYNKTAASSAAAAADATNVDGMGLYATTCLLGLNKDGPSLTHDGAAGSVPFGLGAVASTASNRKQFAAPPFQQLPVGGGNGGFVVGGGSSESSCTDNNGRPGSSSGGSAEHAALVAAAPAAPALSSCPHRGCPCGSSGTVAASFAAAQRDSPPGLPHFADILPPPPRYPPPPGGGACYGGGADVGAANVGLHELGPATQMTTAPAAALSPYHHQSSLPTALGALAVNGGGGGCYCPHCVALASIGGPGHYPVATLSANAAPGTHYPHHGLPVDGSGGSIASSASSGSRRTLPPPQLHRTGCGHPAMPLPAFAAGGGYGAAPTASHAEYASCRDTYPHPYSTFGSQHSGGGGSSGRSCHDYAEPDFLDQQSVSGSAAGQSGLSGYPMTLPPQQQQHFMAASGCRLPQVGCCPVGVAACHSHGNGARFDRPGQCCHAAAYESTAEYDEPWGEHQWAPALWAAAAASAGPAPQPVQQQQQPPPLHRPLPQQDPFSSFATAAPLGAGFRPSLTSNSSGSGGSGGGRAPAATTAGYVLLGGDQRVGPVAQSSALAPAAAAAVVPSDAERDGWRTAAASAADRFDDDSDADEDDETLAAAATEPLLLQPQLENDGSGSSDPEDDGELLSSATSDSDVSHKAVAAAAVTTAAPGSADSKERKGRLKKRVRERQRASGSAARGRPTSPYQGYSTDSSFVFVPRRHYPKASRKKQLLQQQQQQQQLQLRSCTRRDAPMQSEGGSELRDRV